LDCDEPENLRLFAEALSKQDILLLNHEQIKNHSQLCIRLGHHRDGAAAGPFFQFFPKTIALLLDNDCPDSPKCKYKHPTALVFRGLLFVRFHD